MIELGVSVPRIFHGSLKAHARLSFLACSGRALCKHMVPLLHTRNSFSTSRRRKRRNSPNADRRKIDCNVSCILQVRIVCSMRFLSSYLILLTPNRVGKQLVAATQIHSGPRSLTYGMYDSISCQAPGILPGFTAVEVTHNGRDFTRENSIFEYGVLTSNQKRLICLSTHIFGLQSKGRKSSTFIHARYFLLGEL